MCIINNLFRLSCIKSAPKHDQLIQLGLFLRHRVHGQAHWAFAIFYLQKDPGATLGILFHIWKELYWPLKTSNIQQLPDAFWMQQDPLCFTASGRSSLAALYSGPFWSRDTWWGGTQDYGLHPQSQGAHCICCNPRVHRLGRLWKYKNSLTQL